MYSLRMISDVKVSLNSSLTEVFQPCNRDVAKQLVKNYILRTFE